MATFQKLRNLTNPELKFQIKRAKSELSLYKRCVKTWTEYVVALEKEDDKRTKAAATRQNNQRCPP